jgi:hypothetical protein
VKRQDQGMYVWHNNRPKFPPFRLSEVSDVRKEFLLRWQMERKLDRELREADVKAKMKL